MHISRGEIQQQSNGHRIFLINSIVETTPSSSVACFAIHRWICRLNLCKRIDKWSVCNEHLNNRFFTTASNGEISIIEHSCFATDTIRASSGSIPTTQYRPAGKRNLKLPRLVSVARHAWSIIDIFPFEAAIKNRSLRYTLFIDPFPSVQTADQSIHREARHATVVFSSRAHVSLHKIMQKYLNIPWIIFRLALHRFLRFKFRSPPFFSKPPPVAWREGSIIDIPPFEVIVKNRLLRWSLRTAW